MSSKLDKFDRQLLNLMQADASRTAESLAREVPLSPSAIARRLRRLAKSGVINRTVALLSPEIGDNRLRVIVTLELSDHGNRDANKALGERLSAARVVQFFYETAGTVDLVLMLDCADMREFNTAMRDLITHDPTVHRYQSHFIKREFKFAPFVDLLAEEKGAATIAATPSSIR